LFDEHRPERVEVSLYGMTPATFDRITRVPGSHAGCLEGIRRLQARGIPFRLKTMVMAWNRSEIPAMAEFARNLGIGFTYDGLLNPRIDCGANRTGELQLSAEAILAVDLADPERTEELRTFCTRFVRPDAVQPSRHVYTCGAGRSAFSVDPYGMLHPCLLARSDGFALRDAPFARGWNDHFTRHRARTWQHPGPCRSCSLISLCGSCPAAAELKHGDPEGLVVEFCKATHLRAHHAMGDACGHRADASCCLGRVAASGRTQDAAHARIAECGMRNAE
jgi:radical SAM protein with 4Fe4S-binding SPASM domain